MFSSTEESDSSKMNFTKMGSNSDNLIPVIEITLKFIFPTQLEPNFDSSDKIRSINREVEAISNYTSKVQCSKVLSIPLNFPGGIFPTVRFIAFFRAINSLWLNISKYLSKKHG